MKSIEEFPAAGMPLRVRFPKLKVETVEALTRWGLSQPGALPWLMKRSAAYWEALVPEGTGVEETAAEACEATAALDLLKWRIDGKSDKEAVEHLTE